MAATAPGPHPYVGARFALLTMHGKEDAVAPPLREAFAGSSLAVVEGFDTDTLGTFTRDVARAGSQIEAARRKARLACELGGVELGLGSEGAFVPGPFGFGVVDLEIVLLVDRARNFEIVGYAQEHAQALHTTLSDAGALAEFAARADFPRHGLVVRPDDEDDPRIRKGADTAEALEAAFEAALAESRTGRVFVEHDLRAHRNPTRMKVIGDAMRDLVARAASLCPGCALPGFGRVAIVPGRPCRDCLSPTQVPLADEHGCVSCAHRVREPRGGPPWADPARCDLCNP